MNISVRGFFMLRRPGKDTTMIKKITAFLLLLVMIASVFAACGGDGDAGSNEAAESSEESIDPLQVFLVPQKDMQQREFRVLCWDFGYGSNSILGYTGEILYNEENPDSVDDAKKRVIDIIEDRFNCKITGDKVFDKANNVQTIIRNQVTGALPGGYDIVFDSIASTTPLVAEQCLVDLYGVPTIDLSAAWWDQNSVKDLSIANKL